MQLPSPLGQSLSLPQPLPLPAPDIVDGMAVFTSAPFYADPNGVLDCASALDTARRFVAQANGRVGGIVCPAGNYRFLSGATFPRALTIKSESIPSGGIGSVAAPAVSFLKDFNGDLLTFTGSDGLLPGSGGGVVGIRIVNRFGAGITANGAGRGIVLSAASGALKPSWVRIVQCLFEYDVGADSLSWGIDVDGTLAAGVGIQDLWIDNCSAHTAAVNGGAVRLLGAAGARLQDCAFYDAAGHVVISGIAGTPSASCQLSNVSGGTLALDRANDTTVIGGIWSLITNTANTGGNTTLLPGRLVAPFVDNAASSTGMLRYDPTVVGGAAGSWRISKNLLLPNNAGGVVVSNAAGTGVIRSVFVDASNYDYLGLDAADVLFAKALVALGGGGGATLGTIGGAGPTVAAQNSWQRWRDNAGNLFWVPAWK